MSDPPAMPLVLPVRRVLSPEFFQPSYYIGLPSVPRVVAARGINQWNYVCSFDSGYPSSKCISGPSSTHPLCPLWPIIAQRILAVLDEQVSGALCLDVVRIGSDECEGDGSRMVVWIGVASASLSCEEGTRIVETCTEILTDNHISDVDVEIRETSIEKASRVALFDPATRYPYLSKAPQLAQPFTNGISLPISCCSSGVIGTSGVCMRDLATPNQYLLLTARHVVAPFEHSSVGDKISIFTDDAYTAHMICVSEEMEVLNRSVARGGEDYDPFGIHTLGLQALTKVESDIQRNWSKPEERVIGQVFAVPPMNTLQQPDWALIRLDNTKGHWASHNRLNLSAFFSSGVEWSRSDSDHPKHGILDISGVVTRQIAERGDLEVVKATANTGLTLGTTSAYPSYVRTTFNGTSTWIQQQPVIVKPDMTSSRYRRQSGGPFSAKGDSGVAVVTRKGEMFGIVTGGCGGEFGCDFAYVEPMWRIQEDMERLGLRVEMA